MSLYDIFKPIQRRFRRFFRERMAPMTVDEAMEKREFFSKLYLLTTFSIFSYLLYNMGQRRIRSNDPNVSLGEDTIEKLKIDGKTRIIKFEGLTKVKDYYYKRKTEEEEEEEEEGGEKDNSKVELNHDVELLIETSSEVKSEAL